MKIGIVGAAGYIGQFLFNKLSVYYSDTHQLVGYDCRHCDSNTSIKHIRGSNISIDELKTFDIIMYFAGLSGRSQCNSVDWNIVYNENINDVLHIACNMSEQSILLYASSAAVLEGSHTNPVDESYPINRSLLDQYVLSMYERELAINTNPNINCFTIGLRMGTCIGISPNQRNDLLHLSMLTNAFSRGYIDVVIGSCMRSCLWNIDLFNVIVKLIDNRYKFYSNFVSNNKKHYIFNVASFNTSIQRVANEIAAKTGCLTRNLATTSITCPTGFSQNCDYILTFLNENHSSLFKGNHSVLIDDCLQIIPVLLTKNENNPETRFSHLHCRVCQNSGCLITLLDLNEQPLANNFVDSDTEFIHKYPLCVLRCSHCNHTQLSYTVSQVLLFRNYSYVSGTSKTLRDYFNWLSDKTINEFISFHKQNSDVNNKMLSSSKNVLELACNDGFQLDCFKNKGWNTYGVDPAQNLCPIAEIKGHKIFNGFWGVDSFTELNNVNFDLIIAQNVLAHVPDPVRFLTECKKFMIKNHTLLYIQTSQAEMYQKGEFDTIYHEHQSFFTEDSLRYVINSVGLNLLNIEKTDIHGTSFLLKISLCNDNYEATPIPLTVNPITFVQYKNKVVSVINFVKNSCYRAVACGYKIIAYGAAAKGMTLLNAVSLKHGTISYIVDDAPNKHFKYCSKDYIKIYPPTKLTEETDKICILILAWNFYAEIMQKITLLMPNNPYILVIPYPEQIIKNKNDIVIYKNMIKPILFPLPEKKRNFIMTSHFYNEEFLLPYWINHHSPMFDKVVLVDYDSTDKSIEIIERDAPSNWKIIRSRNREFDAQLVDTEIMDLEKCFPLNDYKICLTTTEFLLYPYMRENLHSVDVIRFKSFKICEQTRETHESSQLMSSIDDRLLVEQRHFWCDDKIYLPDDMYGQYGQGDLYSRFMHKNVSNIYYSGRHRVNVPYASWNFDGFIMKFIYAPWPDIKQRKLQIKYKISDADKMLLYGFQHLLDENQLDEKILFINTLQKYNLLYFNQEHKFAANILANVINSIPYF